MALNKQKSANVSHLQTVDAPTRAAVREDERIVRTRRRIDAAFVDLLRRRSYGVLRVSSITKKAGIGRATFYSHYSSKDDLLAAQFRRIVAPMLVLYPDETCPLDASQLLEHIQTIPQIYHSLVRRPDAAEAPRIMRDCFEVRAKQALSRQRSHLAADGSEMETAIMVRFVASALLSVIECWAEREMRDPPKLVNALFTKLVGEGLQSLRLGSRGKQALKI